MNELEQAYVDACVALRETQRAQEEAQRQRELDAARQLAAEAEARRQAEERARQEAEQRAQEQTRSTQRLRGLVAVLVLAFLIAAGVGWYAVIARNTSERQRQIALARQLAAQADLLGNRHPNLLPRSTLLALEAMQRYPTLEADQIVRHGLAILARPVGPPIQHNHYVKAVAFSPNGTYVATASWDKTARVCEAMTGREVFSLTHEGRVETVAFSPDGKYVATGGSDGVQIREITTGQTVSQIKAQEATMVVFSSDGRYLATAGGYSAQVLELPDGQQVFSTTIHDPGLSGPIGPVVFSGDGKYFATTRRGTVKVWEVGSWRTAMDIPHNGSVRPGLNPIFTPITFSPDNRYLVIAAEVYEVSSGQKVADLPQGADGSVAAVTFSLNGEHLATVSGNMARVWTVYGWGEFARMSHRDKITAIAFSPIGSSLATASEDGTARVWEVHRYPGEGPTQEVARMTHGRPVSAIAFSPDGKLLATASEDKTALVWKVTGKQEIARIAHADHMQDVGFSPNGAFLAAVNGDTVHIRDAVSGREVVHMQYGDNRDIEQVVFSPDGRYMVTLAHAHQDVDNQPRRGLQISTPVETMARVLDVSRSQEVASSKLEGVPWIIVSPDGKYLAMNDRDAASTLQVWEVARGQKIAGMKYEIGWKELDKIVFSPDGRYLTIPGEDKSVHIWETGKWQEVRSLPLEARIVRMAFSPNGKYLAAATDSPHNNIHIWKVAEWQQAGSMTHVSLVGYDLVTAMTFSHDGTYLATANKTFDEGASSNNDVRIWEVVSHREVARIQHEEEVTSLVFSGDGRYLAMGSSSIGWVWDLRNHQEVAALHSGATNVAFSPDGRYLLTADSQNKDVAVWFWQPEGLIAEACRRLTRNLTEKLEWPQYLANEPYRKTCPDLP